MNEFKRYRRTQIAEMRPVTKEDRAHYLMCNKDLRCDVDGLDVPENVKSVGVSISKPDRDNGSPKIGDMIARNPKNHQDQWLVAEKYFKDNFETIK